jgi:hypothetical protein
MPTVFIESREEFIQRHGEYVQLDSATYGNRLLFQDGAIWHYGVVNEYGEDPPTDATHLLKLKHLFKQTQLRDATRQLDQICAAVKLQMAIYESGHGPHPDIQLPGWRDYLQQVVTYVETLQQEVDALAVELPRNKRRAEHELHRAANRREAISVIQDLNNLRNTNTKG